MKIQGEAITMDSAAVGAASAASSTPTSAASSTPTSATALSPAPPDTLPFASSWIAAASRRYQHYLDKIYPHVGRRWAWLGALAAAYLLRVLIIQGFFIVTYGLGIYLLNLLIAFLTPQDDPQIQELIDPSGPSLPVKASDEFRPFVRRLPEFRFWYSITKAFCIAFILTFFSVFDVPVFWPILLVYWLVLFTMTMKKQILHMIKYKYVPYTIGNKKRYTGKKVATLDETTIPINSTRAVT